MHALSIPTWMIHISSVIEWIAALWFIWLYGEVTQNRAWWALSAAMLPALVSAMCACTWHYFDNSPTLEWLVTLQAAMTLVGNFTLWAAAWWIWRGGEGDGGTGRGGDWERGRLGEGETGRLGEGETGRLGEGETGRRGDWETGGNLVTDLTDNLTTNN